MSATSPVRPPRGKRHSEWVKLPTGWLREDKGRVLREMKFRADDQDGNLAALMVLMPIAHAVGIAQQDYRAATQAGLSYTDFRNATGLARASIAKGLDRLEALGIIARPPVPRRGRTIVYTLLGADAKGGWAKLPGKSLYTDHGTRIEALCHLDRRRRRGLYALKIYYAIVALRNNTTNAASISYTTLEAWTGVHRAFIQGALSDLSSAGLISTTDMETVGGRRGHRYRVTGVMPHRHNGTVPPDAWRQGGTDEASAASTESAMQPW